MKKEDIEILVKDLCARLPYNTMIHGVYAYENPDYDCGRDPDKILYSEHDSVMLPSDIDWIEMYAADIKPYLFPMSSMTDKQREEYESLCIKVTSECTEFYTGVTFTTDNFYDTIESFDYLYKNHIDVRGLIDKGLAIDATKSKVY